MAGADVWLFGYGSLVWRPDFDFVEQRPARLQGYARRFYQGSTDHRGVPGAPGRVVTLLPDPEAHCWGVAFRVAAPRWPAVVEQLDLREIGGYERVTVSLSCADGATVPQAVTYIATEDNDNYLGPAPLPELAAQVRRSHGPSGPNDEYVLRLARALQAMGVRDPHVEALAGLIE